MQKNVENKTYFLVFYSLQISLLGSCLCKFTNQPCGLVISCFHTLAFWAFFEHSGELAL
jgi:hypothetical protein